MLVESNRLQKSTKGADREKRLGNIGGYTGGNFAYQVYDKTYLAPALLGMGGGGRMPHIVVIYEDRTTD